MSTLDDAFDGLSEEELRRVLKELHRQSHAERMAAMGSKSSFILFIKRIGDSYLVKKIIDFIDTAWDWIVNIFL